MIALTRLSGSVFVLNADLIERVDATPDTVVTLVDGKKFVVREDLGTLVESVLTYRGEIVSRGSRVGDLTGPRAGAVALPVADAVPPRLAVVHRRPDQPLPEPVAAAGAHHHGEA